MKLKDFLKEMEETAKKQKDLDDFYALAEKYGFCTPWCRCEICLV